jgi:hypothetical protein
MIPTHTSLEQAEEVMGCTLEIGKTLLRKAWGNQMVADTPVPSMGSESVADSETALLAVKWLQKAFQTLERAGDGESPNQTDLRVSRIRY